MSHEGIRAGAVRGMETIQRVSCYKKKLGRLVRKKKSITYLIKLAMSFSICYQQFIYYPNNLIT